MEILIGLVVILVIILGVGIRYGLRAGRRINSWETLYTETYEEMKNAQEIFHSLVYRRQLLMDDPEIQRLIKVFDYTLSPSNQALFFESMRNAVHVELPKQECL